MSSIIEIYVRGTSVNKPALTKLIRLKPGQLCTLNNTVYRAKKKTNGCEGCVFNHNVYTCPLMVTNRRKLDCFLDNIILKRI